MDLKGIMIIGFSQGNIFCWSSVKVMAGDTDLMGRPSQYGQRTEEETEVRYGGQGSRAISSDPWLAGLRPLKSSFVSSPIPLLLSLPYSK